ncbi:MAG: DUF192 domain-containing protein [Gemmatimonadaceae bacterium]
MSLRLPLVGRRAAALLALCAAGCGGDSPTDSGPPPNTLTLNGATVNFTLAATCAARTQGLMGVTTLDADAGMLFVFADDRQRGFWMKDTPTPLSVAFFDASKKVVFLADMPAYSTTVYGGLNAPQMRYALETRQGWFAAHGVTVGMTAAFSLPATLTIEPDCP